MSIAFRVVKTTRNDFKPPESSEETEIVWEGTDVIALSTKYPPSKILFADDLGMHSIEDGWISWYHHFEKLVDGAWVRCDDPRVRLNPGLTDLEYALDAENRRLFPGDYLEEEDPYEDDRFDLTHDQLDEVDRELTEDRRVDRQIIKEWEGLTAHAERNLLTPKQQKDLAFCELHFGGKDKLLARRTFLATVPD